MSRGTIARMAWQYTIEEYVRLEESSPIKHEYIKGEIRVMGGGIEIDGRVVMGGGTIAHARISMKIGRLLGNQLEGRPCEAYSSDARLRVLAADLITYPDVVVGCGPVEQDVDDHCAMLNPTVVVEVTSPSSEDYDRGGKLDYYKLVPSVRDVVIVSHRERRIEVHHREDDGTWTLAQGKTGERVQLMSIQCVLDVDAVYHDARLAS